MSEIQTLKPNLLWKWFDQICAIPHPSYHEEEIAQFIVNWAKQKQLFVERDGVGNILIRKPATKGMEDCKTIALQAHLDMVPQANEGSRHDFKKIRFSLISTVNGSKPKALPWGRITVSAWLLV